jgi:hypothetical protein
MIVYEAVFVSVKEFERFFYFLALLVCDLLTDGGVVSRVCVELAS